MKKIEKTDEEWQRELTPEQYAVCRRKGTEPAFTGEYVDWKKAGVFRCCCCGSDLFRTAAKFDSGTGWPSFVEPVSPDSVHTERDMSHGMVRTEVLCSRCDAHLGHVFDDGPPPSGKRFCINSVALAFEPDA